MTALGAGLRWINLLAGILLIRLFTASLLAGPRLRPTARAWDEGLGRWARRLGGRALLSGRLVGVAPLGSPGRPRRGGAGARAAAARAAPGWAGHSAAVEPGALWAALVDMTHLIAAGVW